MSESEQSYARNIVAVIPFRATNNRTYFTELGFRWFPRRYARPFNIGVVLTDDDVTDPISETTSYIDCPETWKLVNDWVATCLNSHRACSKDPLAHTVPTRLVYVGDEDTDIRLCLSTNLSAETNYLTLSHRWGDKIFSTLTRESLAPFLSKIPVDILNKTFHEAVVTTRRLNFQYIWIDSLCIIQDEPSDWQHESSRKGHIYANLSLNITASDAQDGDTGCFFHKKDGIVHNWRVKLRNEKGKETDSAWYCMGACDSVRLVDQSPLQSRAWVFQERFLAPQSLYLDAMQVAWEFRSGFACETLLDGIKNGTMTLPETCISWAKSTGTNISDLWSTIAASYNRRKLTFSRDKPIALACVSRLFSQIFNTEYLAGVWREDLVRQLIWYTTADKFEPRPEEYQAPTRSWASINSDVHLELHVSWASSEHWRPLIHIEEAVVVILPTMDAFGQVEAGHLKLRCQRLKCGSMSPTYSRFSMTLGSDGVELEPSLIYPDISPESFNGHLYFLPVLRTCPPNRL